jgi:hypothetical protein
MTLVALTLRRRYRIAVAAANELSTSLRATGSRERAPDDRLREAIQCHKESLDCVVASAPRNDAEGPSNQSQILVLARVLAGEPDPTSPGLALGRKSASSRPIR